VKAIVDPDARILIPRVLKGYFPQKANLIIWAARAITRGWRVMTDVVDLPKPKFTGAAA
jgi:hypothetical protein